MANTIQIGSARSHPHRIVYGELPAVPLPTGGHDAFPIIIAQGDPDGPILWVTASIHGAEYTGIPVIHDLITPELVKHLHGTIVAVPTLNPAGLRTAQRSPYYLSGLDPNRMFPAPVAKRPEAPTAAETPPTAMEEAFFNLFEHIRQTASFLIDLHNYSLGALSFALRDPVYHRGGRDRSAAEKLQARTSDMLRAFGHTIVNEFASADYLRMNLHRSVSGAALNAARIPAFTAELGGYMIVDQDMVKAAVAGIRNVMRWAGMLDSAPEPITGIRLLTPDHAIRRIEHPHAPSSGIVSCLVKAGDRVRSGEAVARISDIYGRPVGDDNGLIRSQYDGFVLAPILGAVCYRHEPIFSLAVRDEGDLILPFPG